MKRGSETGLAVSVALLLAAGVTNMCSAVARDETARWEMTPQGKYIPIASFHGGWTMADEFGVRMHRRIKMGEDDDRGDFSLFHKRLPGLARATYVPSDFDVRRDAGPRISVSAEDAPTADVLRHLFAQAGVPSVIDSGVSGRITYRGAGIPFHEALREIVYRATPPLYFQVRDGVYVVAPRKANFGMGKGNLVAYGL
jgi:hypothetical protein